MKYRHFIILGDSYTRGYRVALHRSVEASDSTPDRSPILDKIHGLSYSIHSVVTGSPGWESVAAYDPFFEGVRKVDSIDEFIEAVSEDHVLSEADVATYIRSNDIVPESAVGVVLHDCDRECIVQLGHPMYDPDKKDCPSAHILDRGISANRIRAATDGWEMLRIIDQVLAEYEPVPVPVPASDRDPDPGDGRSRCRSSDRSCLTRGIFPAIATPYRSTVPFSPRS